ncbi:MAG: 16S rRNA processing protein RimM [Firmicutes bacterium]|nr:16S rRNA processing protein RimM [Bacillota bacterium]
MGNRIKIGKVTGATGLKGEVRVYSYAESNDRFSRLAGVWLEDDEYGIENVRFHKDMVILKLAGINDRNTAEKVKNRFVYMNEEDLEELPEGQYYVKDLIGLKAVTVSGDEIGTITDILQNTPQDIYEIEKKDGKKALIPGVPDFLKKIDTENGVVVFDPAEGLLDLN